LNNISTTTKIHNLLIWQVVNYGVVDSPLLFYHSRLVMWTICGKWYEFCRGYSKLI